ncbi:MAG TPA: hypothetical protein VLT33_30315 [Labilithrix sp.]|nr:hypothetical protein [Labilithrix sp.]
MRNVVLRSAFFALPLVAAAWAAGCSSSSNEDPRPSSPEAGTDSPSLVDTARPPVDAADAAPRRDCKADQQADGLWQHLECAGLYSDFAAKTVSADAKPYTPGVEFWSDGAAKARFLYLPPGAKIDITDFDEWKLPVGTRVWKEFAVGGKRIETRMLVKAAADDWRHTTYRWNDAETDAVRKDSGEKVPNPAGGSPYEIPSTSSCDACHTGKADQLLGVEAVSMGLPTAKGITLATLAADGRFDRTPPVTTITIPNDQNGTAAPALGWLHANCGACHGKDGISGTDLVWRLRVSQLAPDGGAATVQALDTWTTAVNKASQRPDFDAGVGAFYLRIAGGSPSTSLSSILSGRRVPDNLEPNTTDQMPPLVTRRVDVAGHKLLDDWITQIPP